MSSFKSTFVYFYTILFFIKLWSEAFAESTESTSIVEALKDFNFYSYIITEILQPAETDNDDGEKRKIRVKRQGSGGKYAESAKMSPIKVLRLILQKLKNPVSDDPVGGNHPMSRSVPRPVVQLFKQRITGFFFPDVSDSKTD